MDFGNLNMRLGGSQRGSGPSTPAAAYLDSVLDSVVFELDATIDDSIDDGKWVNLTENPDDGSEQGVYTFEQFGTGDVTLTGEGKDRHWLFDGDTMFQIADNARPAFYDRIHRTGENAEPFWFVVAGRCLAKASGGEVMVGNQTTSNNTGLSCNFATNSAFRMQQHAPGDFQQQVDGNKTYGTVDFLAVFSHNPAENRTRIWVDGNLSEVDHAFTENDLDASASLHIGGHHESPHLRDGWQLKTVAGGKGYLTVAQEQAIRNVLKSRHNKDYQDDEILPFEFTDQTDAETETVVTSDIIQISGFATNLTKAISITGGEYRICDDHTCSTDPGWTDQAGTIQGGQWVQIRTTSSAEFDTPVSVTLTAGEESDEWTVTTEVDPAAAGEGPLSEVIASAVMDLDATQEDSYNGSGTVWNNLIESPADSAAQAAYNFDIVGDITFTGTAGAAAAYFSFDGTVSKFEIAGGNTAFLNALHKTTGGEDFWMAFAFNMPEIHTTSKMLFTTRHGNNPGFTAFVRGDNRRVRPTQRGDTAVSADDGNIAVPEDTDTVIILSYSHSTDTVTLWINSLTGDSITLEFNATTSDAHLPLKLGDWNDSWNFPDGTRFYHFSMGNEYLDNEKAQTIIEHLEARHNRTYVPE